MADLPPNLPAGATIQRSTKLNEVTFLVALLAVIAIIFTLIFALLTLHEPHALGIMLWVMGGGLLLGIAALASPWIGTIKFRAGADGVEGEVDGDKPADAPRP